MAIPGGLPPSGESQNSQETSKPSKRSVLTRIWANACWTGAVVSNLRPLAGCAITKAGGLVDRGCEKVNACSGSFFSRMKHSVSTNFHSMPVQAVREVCSCSKKEKISAKDIIDYQDTVSCGSNDPLPDDTNTRGAVRVLASYLEAFGLEIGEEQGTSEGDALNQSQVVLKSKGNGITTFSDSQISLLNDLLFPVLNGEGIPEKELSRRIHKAFAVVLKTKFTPQQQKQLYANVAAARGRIGPQEISKRTEFTVEGTNVVMEETVKTCTNRGWAQSYCTDKKLTSPCEQTSYSVSKKDSTLETTPTNLHVHQTTVTSKGKTITQTKIRHGASCTHGMKPSTETLLLRLEQRYGITNASTEQSTYDRAQNIIERCTNETDDDMVDLKKRIDLSTAKMLSVLQVAYEADKGNRDLSEPFYFAEMGFLSSGDPKERSMIMDSEMSMEHISRNYRIGSDGTLVSMGEDGKFPDGSREIQILFTQMGINEKQISNDPIQDRINWQTCQKLRIIAKDRQEILDLIEQIENRLKDPNRPYADPDIVHWFDEIYEKLNIMQGDFCKSGKDRTAQAVADSLAQKVGREFKEEFATNQRSYRESLRSALGFQSQEPLAKLVRRTRSSSQKGLSHYLTGANVGKKSGYAFNLFQLSMIPEAFRPEACDCNSSTHS